MAIVRVISDANICLVYTKIVPGREIHFTVNTDFLGVARTIMYKARSKIF